MEGKQWTVEEKCTPQSLCSFEIPSGSYSSTIQPLTAWGNELWRWDDSWKFELIFALIIFFFLMMWATRLSLSLKQHLSLACSDGLTYNAFISGTHIYWHVDIFFNILPTSDLSINPHSLGRDFSMHHRREVRSIFFSLPKAGPSLPSYLSPVQRLVPSQSEFPFNSNCT